MSTLPELDLPDAVAAAAAAGPRVAAHTDAVDTALRAVRAGVDLHYGAGPLADDPDLALLHGDARFAQGLAALAAVEDLVAISELAQTIALVATARARGDIALQSAAWDGAIAGIGWGPDAGLHAARAAARTGLAASSDTVVAAAQARQRASDTAQDAPAQ